MLTVVAALYFARIYLYTFTLCARVKLRVTSLISYGVDKQRHPLILNKFLQNFEHIHDEILCSSVQVRHTSGLSARLRCEIQHPKSVSFLACRV